MAPKIEPYQIAVPEADIEKLKSKLALATLPGETSYSDEWKYGTPLGDIKRLIHVWQNSYDWRAAEAKLNELPHFMTTIAVDGHEDALNVHFIHQEGNKANSIPLLFCHGCEYTQPLHVSILTNRPWLGAGSFLEVIKILPLLTSGSSDADPTFHVVAPSTPNCGFSGRTCKPGLGISQHAEVCHKLMLQLGYQKYGT